jgi:hypothetical protein
VVIVTRHGVRGGQHLPGGAQQCLPFFSSSVPYYDFLASHVAIRPATPGHGAGDGVPSLSSSVTRQKTEKFTLIRLPLLTSYPPICAQIGGVLR